MNKLSNMLLISFVVNVLLLVSLVSIKGYSKDSLDLKAASENKSGRKKFGIYMGGGFYMGLLNPKAYDIYGSLGLLYFPNKQVDIKVGIFTTYLPSKEQISSSSTKSQIIYTGLEFGILYYPLQFKALDLYLGINIGLTLWQSLYARTSILIGSRFHLSKIFDIDIGYGINYNTGSELNFFFSHLFGLYFVFYI